MAFTRWVTGKPEKFQENLDEVAKAIEDADAVLVGAGAGFSAACGPDFAYGGDRFLRQMGDFAEKYGLRDYYSGGFYPFEDEETTWAFWSRSIWNNRYASPVGRPYSDLLRIVRGREHFVLTTNVDHQFQRAGFDKDRLFYTQGDYGLWQCSEPCHSKTYDNFEVVRQMAELQQNMRIPTELVPHCPVCGKPMSMNLRSDDTFVQDEGWYAANQRYADFLRTHESGKVVYLELGVGGNTPGIVKYPFWQMTARNPEATYVQLNLGDTVIPGELEPQSILVDGDAAAAMKGLCERLGV